jgi:hypothetical protein
MVIKDTHYVFIHYSVEAEILLINWKLNPTNTQFKESYSEILNFVGNVCHVTSFCTDLTRVGALSREQEAWLVLEYYPKAQDFFNHNVNVAVVFSDEHFKAIVTNFQQPIYLTRQDFIHFNYFTKPQEAFQWLLDIKKGQDTLSVMSS